MREQDRRALLAFKGVASTAESEEGVRVVFAGAPIARGVDKLFLGHEEPAFSALELLLFYLVVAGFLEGRKSSLHADPRSGILQRGGQSVNSDCYLPKPSCERVGRVPGRRNAGERDGRLARIVREASAAAVDLGLLTGVLGPRPLRRSVQHHLGFSALRVPVTRPVCAASLRTFLNNAG